MRGLVSESTFLKFSISCKLKSLFFIVQVRVGPYFESGICYHGNWVAYSDVASNLMPVACEPPINTISLNMTALRTSAAEEL